MPVAVLWDAWRTMESLAAWQRLQWAHGVAMGQPVREEQASERAQRVEQEHALAFPPPE